MEARLWWDGRLARPHRNSTTNSCNFLGKFQEVVILSYQRDHFVKTADLSLPYLDDISGTIRGYRVFTACRTVNGKIFRLDDHLERLYVSAKSIYMKPPMDRPALKAVLRDVVEMNKKAGAPGDLLIDIIFSGGLAGSSMEQSGAGAHLYVTVQELVPPTPEMYANGVALATYMHLRLCPEIKLLNYIGAILAHQSAVPKHNAFEALFVEPPEGNYVLEGSTFSVFFVTPDNVVVTPPLDGKILDSITRKVVIELLVASDIKLNRRPITLDEALAGPESFLVSTTRNVLPVTRINEHMIGSGRPGPLTGRISDMLNSYMASH